MTEPAKPKKTFLQVLWDIVFTIFYPILIVFSLLFVGVVYLFSAISWLLSWLLPRRKEETSEPLPAATWESWIVTDTLNIERIMVEEIMFGPAYYQLRTLPSADTLDNRYFGDFHHLCFGGVLLQKWNTVVPKELPDFDLLFFSGTTRQLYYLKTIKAFTWHAAETPEGVTLQWEENGQGGQIMLTEDHVLHDTQLLDK